MLPTMEAEPARRITGLVAAALVVFNAAVRLVGEFGVNFTVDQLEAIYSLGNGVGGVALVLFGGSAIRARVEPYRGEADGVDGWVDPVA